MTIKEISKKYHIPYHLTYEATVGVDTYESWIRDREYPEDQVVHNAVALIKQRIERRKEYIAKAEKTLAFIDQMKRPE